eukprot:104652_1
MGRKTGRFLTFSSWLGSCLYFNMWYSARSLALGMNGEFILVALHASAIVQDEKTMYLNKNPTDIMCISSPGFKDVIFIFINTNNFLSSSLGLYTYNDQLGFKETA